MIYLYDETFNGFLTCVFKHYYDEKADGIHPISSYQENLLNPGCPVTTDEKKADRVYEAIENKISSYDLARVYKVFSSCDSEKEMKILRYLRLGFKHGSKIRLYHGEPIVFDIEAIEKKVNFEIHRLYGIIRFSMVESKINRSGDNEFSKSILYSPIEPDNDVVEFLANHFTDRFKNDPFIIHDKRRNKALVSAANQWYVTDFTENTILENTDDEKEYRKLWKQYFDTIAIKERTNPKCQRNFMPVRYWKNLTEFKSTNTL